MTESSLSTDQWVLKTDKLTKETWFSGVEAHTQRVGGRRVCLILKFGDEIEEE